MANTTHAPSESADPELAGRADMADDFQNAQAARTDEVGPAALPLAVDEEDAGAMELHEEYGDWQDDYADAVGISRWREL
jgi:hypothetical protein